MHQKAIIFKIFVNTLDKWKNIAKIVFVSTRQQRVLIYDNKLIRGEFL